MSHDTEELLSIVGAEAGGLAAAVAGAKALGLVGSVLGPPGAFIGGVIGMIGGFCLGASNGAKNPAAGVLSAVSVAAGAPLVTKASTTPIA